jgi:hypothetical protein
MILRPLPPFRLDLTAWALRRRPRNDIDRWDGTTHRRLVTIGARVTELAVRQSGPPSAPRVTVTATPSSARRPRDATSAPSSIGCSDCRSTCPDGTGWRIAIGGWPNWLIGFVV